MKTLIQSLLGKKLHEIPEKKFFLDVQIPEPERIGDESYVEFPSLGISMVLPDGETISAIQLHGEGHEGYSQFSGEIHSEITFQMSRDQIREYLGSPVQHGDGGKVVFLGDKPAWDAYSIDGHRFHFEYTRDNKSIQLVTISPASF